MNEFGEIAIDSQIIEGKNIRIADLGGGCVCCSLLGEFEAAVTEVTSTRCTPTSIIVETTGVAEPDALVVRHPGERASGASGWRGDGGGSAAA